MNLLIDPLPKFVVVESEEYPILTDYRDWILFDQLIRTDKIDEDDKPLQMMQWYVDKIPNNITAGSVPLLNFYNLGQTLSKPGAEKAKSELRPSSEIMDYNADAGRILAAFRDCYGIDILRVEMHWWEFRALLDNTSQDTAFKTVIGYRAADTKGMSKHQKEFYGKMKKLYALGDKGKSLSLERRNEAMKDYVKRRQQEVG